MNKIAEIYLQQEHREVYAGILHDPVVAYAKINNAQNLEKCERKLKKAMLLCKEEYNDETINDLKVKMGKYEMGIKKLVECYDSEYSDFQYNNDEIIRWIESLEYYYQEVGKILEDK